MTSSSSYAIEQQTLITDELPGSHNLAHAIHGLQSFDTPLAHMSLPSAKEHPLFYIGVYSALGLGSAFIGVLTAIAQYTGALRASRVLFKQLLVSVVRATMRWHDTTPQGALSLSSLNVHSRLYGQVACSIVSAR